MVLPSPEDSNADITSLGTTSLSCLSSQTSVAGRVDTRLWCHWGSFASRLRVSLEGWVEGDGDFHLLLSL